jgi:tetratricopeptide (TPR) repeat protein
MKIRIAAATAIGLATLVSPLRAQTPNDCYQATLKTDDREIIRVCTAALERGGIQGETLSITLSNRGLGYLRNKEYDKSIIDFSEALLINPKNPYAFNSRGEAWREKGNLERALADFAESLNVDATFAAAYYNRGVTYERQNNPAAARAEYQKALDQRGDRAIDNWARDNARARLAALDGNQQRQDNPRQDNTRQDQQNQRDRDSRDTRSQQDRQNQRQDNTRQEPQQQYNRQQPRGTEGGYNR